MGFIIHRAAGAHTLLRQVSGETLRIGRDAGAELRLDDGAVAFDHAVIRAEAGGWTLEDRGSVTGTYLGGRRVTSVKLAAGDVIDLGTELLGSQEQGRLALEDAVGDLVDHVLRPIGEQVGTERPQDLQEPVGGEPVGGRPAAVREVEDELGARIAHEAQVLVGTGSRQLRGDHAMARGGEAANRHGAGRRLSRVHGGADGHDGRRP